MSATENQKVVEVLRELNEFVHDGLEGYERAAKESTDDARIDMYQHLSQQRLAFANELNQIIQRHGGSPERDTTNKGKLYRQWMDFKAALTGRDEAAILSSNIYGEEWAQKAYRDALDEDLPYDVRGVLLRQREASAEALRRLHQIREATTTNLTDALPDTVTNNPWRTALYTAGALAGAALVYGLASKRIPVPAFLSKIHLPDSLSNVKIPGLSSKKEPAAAQK